MKTYCPGLPGESRDVALHLVGRIEPELSDDVETPVGKLAIGRIVHVADQRLNPGRQRRGGPAPVEDRHLMTRPHGSLDAGQGNLAGAADVENAERHRLSLE